MGGYLMQLQNFSVNDGEGIRTIIFMAGCPLRCAWCANPEGQTCQNTMTHWAETDEVLQKLRKQEIFYRYSDGGVTFSGGEATAQPQFLAELTDALYDDGISLALETCGQFDFDTLRPVLQKMDLIFMDLKHPDTEAHRRFTGVGNETILQNLQKTAALGVPLVVRIPVIAGVNADDWSCCPTTAMARPNMTSWVCRGHRLPLPHRRRRSLPVGKRWRLRSMGYKWYPTNDAQVSLSEVHTSAAINNLLPGAEKTLQSSAKKPYTQ